MVPVSKVWELGRLSVTATLEMIAFDQFWTVTWYRTGLPGRAFAGLTLFETYRFS
jgi:hypothetical protein